MKRYILILTFALVSLGSSATYAQTKGGGEGGTQSSFLNFQMRQVETMLKLEGDRLTKFRELFSQYYAQTRASHPSAEGEQPKPQPQQQPQPRSTERPERGERTEAGAQRPANGGERRTGGGRGTNADEDMVRGIYERIDTMSDAEIDAEIKESFERAKRAIELKESYYTRFREFLSPREVATMYELERRTRERLVDELSKRAPMGGQTNAPSEKR
ncbi:MAG: hypothetical protein R3Y16_02990 [Rikenellaceae bacterium]